MKRYKQEWRKRLISSFLILCMLCTSIDLTAFAIGGSVTGSQKVQESRPNSSGVGTVSDNISKGSGQITSFDPSCSWAQNPGYIIKLVSIENDYDSSYSSLVENGQLTENQASLMKEYYVYFPTHDFIDDPGTVVSESAFISYCGTNSNSAIRKCGSVHLGDEKG